MVENVNGKAAFPLQGFSTQPLREPPDRRANTQTNKQTHPQKLQPRELLINGMRETQIHSSLNGSGMRMNTKRTNILAQEEITVRIKRFRGE